VVVLDFVNEFGFVPLHVLKPAMRINVSINMPFGIAACYSRESAPVMPISSGATRTTDGIPRSARRRAREHPVAAQRWEKIVREIKQVYEVRPVINAASAASHLAVVFLWSLRRGFVSRLDCVLLGHVFALPRRAVKTRAFPVVNTCLGVNPHLAMASAGRGWVGRFLGRAPCGHWACSRTRFPLSLRFLRSGFCFG
jgi:hypothetical protein